MREATNRVTLRVAAHASRRGSSTLRVMPNLNTDTAAYLEKLKAAVDARMQHASTLAASAARREQAQAELAAAEAAYARDHRAAVNAGWTERELRDAGLTAPSTARGAGSRRGTRARTASTDNTAQQTEPRAEQGDSEPLSS